MERNKLLYIDGLNFQEEFGLAMKVWNVAFANKKISEFVDAANASGYQLKVFIDAGIETEETLEKWMKRRECHVEQEKRGVPQGSQLILGALFKKHNVEIHYSPSNCDNDDFIAGYAHRDGADILSNDKDFFRYKGSRFVVYGSFHIDNGKLKLRKKKIPEHILKKIDCDRSILNEIPESDVKYPGFVDVVKNRRYLRGAPSALVKLLGNPHKRTRDIRRAIYCKLGVKDDILESWPSWDVK